MGHRTVGIVGLGSIGRAVGATLAGQYKPWRKDAAEQYLNQLGQTLAQLLGRRGGLSAFTTDELEALGKLYPRVDCTAALLRQAVEQSPEKTIPAIAFQLQRLSDGQATTQERKTKDAGP